MVKAKVLNSFVYCGVQYLSNEELTLSLNELDKMVAQNFEIVKFVETPSRDKMIRGKETLPNLIFK